MMNAVDPSEVASKPPETNDLATSTTVNGTEGRKDVQEPGRRTLWDSVSGSMILVFSSLYVFLLLLPFAIYTAVWKLFRRKKSITGKICVITGTGRGMGRALAIKMSELGAIVVCLDINVKNNKETVDKIRRANGKAYDYQLNVGKREEVMNVFDKIEKEHGKIDILVNNAGLVMGHTVKTWTEPEIISMYNVNVFSHYWTISACLPLMMERNEGQIVTISSMSAVLSVQFMSMYGATKAAIAAMSDSLRYELDLNPENKVKVTTIFPYFVNTSADYLPYFSTRTHILDEDQAVKKILDAILYEETNISIPEYMYASTMFLRLVPRTLSNHVLKMTGASRVAPTEAFRKSLVYYDIVEDLTKRPTSSPES